jgi:hypothetical protein
MRKSKIKVGNIDESLFLSFMGEPVRALDKLDTLSITLPEWAKLVLLTLRNENFSLEAAFYEDAKDFFLSYTKRLLKANNPPDFICFSQEQNGWKHFVPPTLIGTNLKTKLRKS